MTARARSRAPWALAALFAAVASATFGDYGTTWDEGVQSLYGDLVVRYYTSGGADRRCNEMLDLRLYGPLFEGLAALVGRLRPEALWEIRHALTALSASLAVAATGLAARRLDPRLGLPAALALVLLPRFYGHAFDNSKDVPFASAFAASVLAILYLQSARRIRAVHVLLAGLAIGAALSVRIGGVILFGLLALALAPRLRREPTTAMVAMAGVVALAWTLMVAAWPWAHEAPIGNPLRALRGSLSFHARYPVLFEGVVQPSDALPRRYAPELFAITTPPLHLLLALVGLLAPWRRGPRRTADLIVRVWWVAPLLLAVLLRPGVYDGVRHLTFVMPAMAILAARGAALIIDRLSPRRTWAHLGACLPLLLPIPALVRLHPYQYTYFNALVGGLRGADGRFETDYWAASYRAAIEWIEAQAPGGQSSVLVAANSYSIVCASPWAGPGIRLTALFRPGVPGKLPEGFDYYVATTRYDLDSSFGESPIVHTIGRDGAVFSVIRARVPSEPAATRRSLPPPAGPGRRARP